MVETCPQEYLSCDGDYEEESDNESSDNESCDEISSNVSCSENLESDNDNRL